MNLICYFDIDMQKKGGTDRQTDRLCRSVTHPFMLRIEGSPYM